MQITIRAARENDMSAVHALITELAVYEKAPHAVTNTVADMIKDGFGEHPVFKCQVAENSTGIVGMALYYIKYSTWKGKGIYLDDLVVTDACRGKGIGTLLLNAVISHAAAMDAAILNWQVLEWNETAISFYKKYDVVFDSEWINCKLDRAALMEASKKIQL